MIKICTDCKRSLELVCFSIDRASRDGLQRCCKDCSKVKTAANLASKPFRGSWHHMLDRCYRPSHKSFKNYGGRGIEVCAEWRKSYESYRDFRFSIGDSMQSSLSLDRVNNDGNYTPENCRLATAQEQGLNKRKQKSKSNNPQSTFKNVFWHKPTSRWHAQVTRNGRKVHIGYYLDEAAAHQAVLKYLANLQVV